MVLGEASTDGYAAAYLRKAARELNDLLENLHMVIDPVVKRTFLVVGAPPALSASVSDRRR